MRYTRIIKADKQQDKNWLVKVYNQLAEEKYIKADMWHDYINNAMIKNAKFCTAISAQRLEAKASAVLSVIPDLIKQARIYTDFGPLITSVYNRSLQNGGSSTYIDTGLPVNKNNLGYMVAKQDSVEKIIPQKEFNAYEIEKYVKENMNQLKQDNTFLGTWFYEGNWYLDSSEKIDSCILAMKLGIDRNQIAIYDLQRDKSIGTEEFKNIDFDKYKDLWTGKSDYNDLLKLKEEQEKE